MVILKNALLDTQAYAGPFKNSWTPTSFWKLLRKMSLSQFLSKVQKGSSDRKSRCCLCPILEKDHDIKNGNRHGLFKNHWFMERCGLTDVCALVVNFALDRNIKLPYKTKKCLLKVTFQKSTES